MIEQRPYAEGEQSKVTMFTGEEVEHSPAHGLRTLFIVGLQTTEDIDEILSNTSPTIEHIYFGANMSFDLANNDADGWRAWEDLIGYFLDKGYLCTLDITADRLPGLLDGGLCEHSRFIPMISVRLPYTRLLNYNTTIKIDDLGFDKTNPGVWCWRLGDLMDTQRFTPWHHYRKDQPVK